MKPACGSGEEAGEYDLPLHVVALCTYTLEHQHGLNHWANTMEQSWSWASHALVRIHGAPGVRRTWYTDADVQERAFPSWRRRSSG